ncbi:hypothetical protein H0E87_006319 [Populus deltoides]|uniref:Uncharacterized protein n=1 Tax=Populus deltoides TaxID=3696 RepID=A0A8T2Z6J5_POPDE|nr:hypothetical protein H0E87_006319 [Populus deltoides]
MKYQSHHYQLLKLQEQNFMNHPHRSLSQRVRSFIHHHYRMRKPRNWAPTSWDHQQHLMSTLTTGKLPYGLPLSTNKSISILTWQDRLFQKLLGVRYVNLTARALTEGGFESLFILIFETDPSEKLEKTSACYLSTSTGPVYWIPLSINLLEWLSAVIVRYALLPLQARRHGATTR